MFINKISLLNRTVQGGNFIAWVNLSVKFIVLVVSENYLLFPLTMAYTNLILSIKRFIQQLLVIYLIAILCL